MGKYPIETGNIVLILLGIALTLGGPWIVYRAFLDIRTRLDKGETLTGKQWLSHGLNFLIAALFFFAGVLFVLNNLRGNPLH